MGRPLLVTVRTILHTMPWRPASSSGLPACVKSELSRPSASSASEPVEEGDDGGVRLLAAAECDAGCRTGETSKPGGRIGVRSSEGGARSCRRHLDSSLAE